jgi:hypothetical protein
MGVFWGEKAFILPIKMGLGTIGLSPLLGYNKTDSQGADNAGRALGLPQHSSKTSNAPVWGARPS